MKKSLELMLSLSLGFFLLIASGCQKNKTGDLVVNVVDGLNSSVGSGKTVYLYNSAADFSSSTYSKTATTDSEGQVTFSKLTPGVYYVDCDWENNLGFTITSTGSGEITKKMVTTITAAP
jgi:hypothetical protein